jgi:hypothetical protein
MGVVGAILLGWVLAGIGVVALLNVAKWTVYNRSLRMPHTGGRRQISTARRRKMQPAIERHPSSGRQRPYVHLT